MLRKIDLSLIAALLMCSCSSVSPKDYALRNDDWKSWCAMESIDAREGNEIAMNNVGTCYLQGLGGFPQNRQLAMQWFTESARRGNKAANLNLEQYTVATADELLKSESRAQLDLNQLLALLPEQ